jgi:hypothetical protein
MSAPPTVPRWDETQSKYVWEAPAPPAEAVEPPAPRLEPPPAEEVAPEFVVAALERKFEPDQPRTMTFQDSYPFVGTPLVDPPPREEYDDGLDDFRVAPHVADRLLAGLPLDTPRFLRALLTLLLGAARADRS